MRTRRGHRALRALLAASLAGLALALLWAGFSAAAPADLPETVAYDPAVAALLDQVTTATLAYELAGLTGERPVTVTGSAYTITTRNSYYTEQISMATRYAYEQLAGYGLSTTFHTYTWNGNHWRNVVAEKPGLVDPERIYLLTAHVDSMPEALDSPGADDNGSGSVAVLAAARLLAPRMVGYTVRFVLFTGEEQGLRGSAVYAQECDDAGDDVRGVINLDMIAYNSDAQPIVDLYGSSGVPGSLALTRLFSDVVGVYGLNLIPDRFDVPSGFPIQYSDQWSFLQQDYPAFLAIEDWDDHTPHYHQNTDRLSALDLDYYADVTRAAVGTLAHLAWVLPAAPGTFSGTVTDGQTGYPVAGATVVAVSPVPLTYTSSADANGVYSTVLPAGSYTVTFAGGALPYYTVTLTDVMVVTETVTTRKVTLAPWERLYLPLAARDG